MYLEKFCVSEYLGWKVSVCLGWLGVSVCQPWLGVWDYEGTWFVLM